MRVPTNPIGLIAGSLLFALGFAIPYTIIMGFCETDHFDHAEQEASQDTTHSSRTNPPIAKKEIDRAEHSNSTKQSSLESYFKELRTILAQMGANEAYRLWTTLPEDDGKYLRKLLVEENPKRVREISLQHGLYLDRDLSFQLVLNSDPSDYLYWLTHARDDSTQFEFRLNGLLSKWLYQSTVEATVELYQASETGLLPFDRVIDNTLDMLAEQGELDKLDRFVATLEEISDTYPTEDDYKRVISIFNKVDPLYSMEWLTRDKAKYQEYPNQFSEALESSLQIDPDKTIELLNTRNAGVMAYLQERHSATLRASGLVIKENALEQSDQQ